MSSYPLIFDLFIMCIPYTWSSNLTPFDPRIGDTVANTYNNVLKAKSRQSILLITTKFSKPPKHLYTCDFTKLVFVKVVIT